LFGLGNRKAGELNTGNEVGVKTVLNQELLQTIPINMVHFCDATSMNTTSTFTCYSHNSAVKPLFIISEGNAGNK
jgi:hypothetical protein